MPLSLDDKKKYKSLYLQTARQYVMELQKNIAFLKKGKTSREVIDTLHRAAHSLNSQSNMMSYESISMVASRLEKLFDDHKGKKTGFVASELQLLSQIIGHLNDGLDNIEADKPEKDLTKDAERIDTIGEK
jgi:chemotaxis protein histidine kinase CheA